MLHASQIYHRDIAPDNVLLMADTGRPLLLDFGAARRVIGDMTQALTAILKPGYAPVEQYADMPGLKQGPWTDVYALAAVVHWIDHGQDAAALGRPAVRRPLRAAGAKRGRPLQRRVPARHRPRPRGHAREAHALDRGDARRAVRRRAAGGRAGRGRRRPPARQRKTVPRSQPHPRTRDAAPRAHPADGAADRATGAAPKRRRPRRRRPRAAGCRSWPAASA